MMKARIARGSSFQTRAQLNPIAIHESRTATESPSDFMASDSRHSLESFRLRFELPDLCFSSLDDVYRPRARESKSELACCELFHDVTLALSDLETGEKLSLLGSSFFPALVESRDLSLDGGDLLVDFSGRLALLGVESAELM